MRHGIRHSLKTVRVTIQSRSQARKTTPRSTMNTTVRKLQVNGPSTPLTHMAANEMIRVSAPVKGELEDIRDEGDHTSIDSALRQILRDAGHDV